MRGSFVEDMFEHYPAIILRDDMLEGLVREGESGCSMSWGVDFSSAWYIMI